MANFRLPGPVCLFLGALPIDTGTLCRSASAPPGVLQHDHPAHARKHHLTHHRQYKAKSVAVAVPVLAAEHLTEADFEAAARSLGPGISPALVHAFAEVESNGRTGFGEEGLPVIAYEGHRFRKYTYHKFDNDYPYLSYLYVEKAGVKWRHNNANQKTAWATLNAALELDHEAALKSCSWGMFQVMGFNFQTCGYGSVDNFVVAMKAGESRQLEAFVGFCKSLPSLLKSMREKDFAAMAMFYNGEDYGDYDQRIARAYQKYGGA